MKQSLVLGIFCFFVSSVFAAYTPTTQETAIVSRVIPMIQDLGETEFEQVYSMLSKLKVIHHADTRKGWLAQVLLESMETKLAVLDIAKKDAAIPRIDTQMMKDLLSHIPQSQISGKDIVLLEFTDLECPFCKRFHDAGTLATLTDTYTQVGAVSLAFPLSFHPHAEYAANMTQCVWRELGYEEAVQFKSELFASNFGSIADIDQVLATSALGGTNAVATCMTNDDSTGAVQQQITLGKALGVRGTPSTIVLDLSTGRYAKVSGAQSDAAFMPIIDAMLQDNRSFFHKPVSPAPGAGGVTTIDQKSYTDFLKTVYIQGNPDAEVTVIEFSDVQCPFCQKHVTNGTIDAVQEKYGEQVNTIFAHFPLSFHTNAQDAAEAIECAGKQGGNEGYFTFKQAYFEVGGDASLSKAKIAAEAVGLDGDVLLDCVESNIFEQLVKDQMAFGRSLGVTGTPGNVIIDNNTLQMVKISGAYPVDAFTTPIERFFNN